MKFDAIVVLGYGLTNKGKPGKILRSRLDLAVELYNRKMAPRIIMLGGFTNSNIDISEAEGMKQHAINKGIPRQDILKEESSGDTIGNVFFLKQKILKRRGWKTILVVTSDFHVKRAGYIFKKILGPDYTIKFKQSKAFSIRELFCRVIRMEKDFFYLTKHILKDIKPGDDRAIRNLMKNNPFYSKDKKPLELLKLSDVELAEKLGIDVKFVRKYRGYVTKRLKKFRK